MQNKETEYDEYKDLTLQDNDKNVEEATRYLNQTAPYAVSCVNKVVFNFSD